MLLNLVVVHTLDRNIRIDNNRYFIRCLIKSKILMKIFLLAQTRLQQTNIVMVPHEHDSWTTFLDETENNSTRAQ